MSSSQFFICNYTKTNINSKTNCPSVKFLDETEEHNFYKSLISVHRNVAFNSKKLFLVFNNPQLLPDDVRDVHKQHDGSDGYFLLKDNIQQFKKVVENIDNNTHEATGFKEFIETYKIKKVI